MIAYFHVPPIPELFSKMMKLWHLLRLMRSMAMHMPEMPAPMITTAACVCVLLLTRVRGHCSEEAVILFSL